MFPQITTQNILNPGKEEAVLREGAHMKSKEQVNKRSNTPVDEVSDDDVKVVNDHGYIYHSKK